MTDLGEILKIDPPAHFFGADGVASLTGGSIRRFERLLPKACRRKYPTGMVVTGACGTGKTFGTRLALWRMAQQDALPVDLVVGLSANGPTNKSDPRAGRMSEIALCRALVSVIDGVKVTNESFAELEHVLLPLLSERRVLVVIDEGEQIEPRALNFVQSLIDNPDAWAAFVLIGTSAMTRRLRRDAPALASRLPYPVPYEALTQQQALRVLPMYHPRFKTTPRDVMKFVNRRVEGRFRHWAAFAEEANDRLAETEGVSMETAMDILGDIEHLIIEVRGHDEADRSR